MIRRAAWLDVADKIPEGYDKYFVGDECCARFLYKDDSIERFYAIVNSGTDAGFIAPYLTAETEGAFCNFIKKIPRPVEIAVNDYGAFDSVKKYGHVPVIGRLLTKQNTDPEIIYFNRAQPDRVVYCGGSVCLLKHGPPPELLKRHFRNPPIFCEEAVDYLKSGLGVLKVMIDYPPHGLPDDPPSGVEIYLNLTNVLVSVIPCGNCKNCGDDEKFIGTLRSGVSVYRRRNVCYYKRDDAEIGDLTGRDYIKALIV